MGVIAAILSANVLNLHVIKKIKGANVGIIIVIIFCNRKKYLQDVYKMSPIYYSVVSFFGSSTTYLIASPILSN